MKFVGYINRKHPEFIPLNLTTMHNTMIKAITTIVPARVQIQTGNLKVYQNEKTI